jgi:hypothetical protein
LVARRKAKDGDDIQKPWMNEGGLEAVGSKRWIQKGCRPNPFVLEGSRALHALGEAGTASYRPKVMSKSCPSSTIGSKTLHNSEL